MNLLLTIQETQQLPLFLLSAGHGEGLSFFDWLLSTNAINIAIAFVLLVYVVKKFNLLGIFDTQQEKIRKEVETLEQEKKAALKELNTIKKQTKNLSDEVESILNDAKTSAETLSEQILADAQRDASKIVEMSKKRIEVEQRSAMKTLEKRLLLDSIEDAQKELVNLSDDDKGRSVESFINELAHTH